MELLFSASASLISFGIIIVFFAGRRLWPDLFRLIVPLRDEP